MRFACYFGTERLRISSWAAEVYCVYYLCDECSESSPAKVPPWGPRKLFISREDGGFRNKEFQTTVIYIYIYVYITISLSWQFECAR